VRSVETRLPVLTRPVSPGRFTHHSNRDKSALTPAIEQRRVTVNSLEQAIAAYQEALADLPQNGSPDAASKSLNLLLLRDELAGLLAQTPEVPAALIIKVNSLDEKLKRSAVTIDRAAGRSTMSSWRQSLHPMQSPWWWNLDERAAAAEPGQ